MVKKGETIELKIEDIIFPNKGVGYVDDKKIIIKNTLPGQTAKISISKKRKGKIEGRLLEVLEKSSEEINAPCPVFGFCGGCTYQNLPYDKQLKLKEKMVLELLSQFNIKEKYLGIEGSIRTFEYRNKMEFSFGDEEKNGPLTLGMHKRGNFYDVINTDNCLLVDNDYRMILINVLKYFADLKETYYHKRTHLGFLRHLVVRKGINTGEILINLVTTSQSNLNKESFKDMLIALNLEGKIKSILYTINDNVADTVIADSMEILYGNNHIVEKLFNLRFKIYPFSFFQTNTKGAEQLYSTVRELAGKIDDKTVFDLYCGTGTIAQIMAPNAKKVIGIEIVEEAVKSANENAEINNLKNCHFIAGDVMEMVKNLEEKPDLIILDPPRDGIHPKAINKIIDFMPKEFIYVSCKPTSLARDLPFFLNRGYEIENIKCVDMFPQTPHVETVVKLYRK